MADTIKIKLVKSLAGVKIGDTTEQPANAATEGKIFKVTHLIEVTR